MPLGVDSNRRASLQFEKDNSRKRNTTIQRVIREICVCVASSQVRATDTYIYVYPKLVTFIRIP